MSDASERVIEGAARADAAALDDRLGLVGVLHELTVGCVDLFDPVRSLDDLLHTLAARLGCSVALLIQADGSTGDRLRLGGAVGIARSSRELPLPPRTDPPAAIMLPYAEVASAKLARWVIEVPTGSHDPRAQWWLMLFFDTEPRLVRQYRGMLARLARTLGAALAHRTLHDEAVTRERALGIASSRLSALNEELEARVEARTLELAAANRGLADSLSTLNATRRQLAIRDRMASLGTLAAGIAHEINGPLAIIGANLDMVLEELHELGPGTMAPITQMAADARIGAEHVRKIVRGLKAFSRVDDAARHPVELHAVVELAISLAQNELRHRANVVRELGPVPWVLGEEGKLAQVVINLLVNAAQALPDGGAAKNVIRVATRMDLRGRAVIEISDTGGGIPPEALDRLFEPFYTTKPAGVGTGLGLAICHGIVTSFGGDIGVESELGRGTTFRIALPAAPDARPARPVSSHPGAQRPSAAVLIVDDDPLVSSALGRVLRAHDVTIASDGPEALVWLASHPQVDVIFCDLMMPQMTGMEFHAELSRRAPALAERIVFMTGGAFTAEAREFLARVPNDRIDKPFDVRAVRRIVRQH